MLALLSICSVYLFTIKITSAQNSCKTPDNWNGNCIVLQQCRPLFSLIASGQLTTEQIDFLRRSQCGSSDGNPYVCCPHTFTIADLPSNDQCGIIAADRIIGGEETSLIDFSWMALLSYRRHNHANGDQDGFLCGGALIHEKYVITAAHCINGDDIVERGWVLNSVRFGENDLRTDPDCQANECADPVVDILVAEANIHENYMSNSNSQANDIALIRLQHAVQYTEFIRPICLPFANNLRDKNYDGIPLHVAGFGKTANATRSEIKLKVEVNGYNWERCSNIYRNAGITLTTKQLCAGGNDGRDTCNGDSGGPLVATQLPYGRFAYLLGIVSFGPRYCGISDYPGIYTRIDAYIEWILDHMKK